MKFINLKKSVFVAFFCFTVFALIAEDFELPSVPADFIGTYVPVAYENMLKDTKNHYTSLVRTHSDNYDILILKSNICYSNLLFNDSYAIERINFEKWNFTKNNQEYFITDERGSTYRRLSQECSSKYYIENTLSIIFEDAIQLKTISLSEDNIIIDNELFDVILSPTFVYTLGVNLWISNKEHKYALSLQGTSAKLYEGQMSEYKLKLSNKVIRYFPLFYWNDKLLENIEYKKLQKEQIRLLRNLVYAKKGYIFNSDDLQKIFEDFEWYDPITTVPVLTTEETQFVEKLLLYENSLD